MISARGITILKIREVHTLACSPLFPASSMSARSASGSNGFKKEAQAESLCNDGKAARGRDEDDA
jgi:hypothetical protein